MSARAAIAEGAHDKQRVRPAPAAFAASPSVSIDVAVMERSERVAVVPSTLGWSDVGSWDALYEVSAKDANGNTLGGEVRAIDATDLLVRAEGLSVTCIDVHGLTIVATPDAVLVMPRGSSQRVREAVDALAAANRKDSQ
jgi:mannose-1-phosphate guanylyltransferase/mannose-1-phosphate guanylyltransferase/mannose-6-phosphate isomerase